MDDLKLIKKYYGEKMMHLCREFFPSILENEGSLFSILSTYFSYSKFLYEDIVNNQKEVEFKNYIFSLADMAEPLQLKEVNKTPKELLDEAGYILYECHNEDDIQRFRKYYAPREELCTFNGNRLYRCHVFFAVKKNVDRIKRENYTQPERQDEYGTSVISIQFTKDSLNTLSIKNRYNHTVKNPDNTFSNNLENIIPGLTNSFNKYYGLHVNNKISDVTRFEMPDYVCINGKYYKYNFEQNNIYYCPDNIIIDNFEIKTYNKSQYLIVDNYVIDLVNKRIYPYDKNDTNAQAFVESIGNINSIKIEKDEETENKNIIINNEIVIGINAKNQIIKYINNKVTAIGNSFLYDNKTLEYLELNEVQYIEDDFLHSNEVLRRLNLPKVIKIGCNALANNKILEEINMPKVKYLDEKFAQNNRIRIIDLPSLEELGTKAFNDSGLVETINLPNLTIINREAFHYAEQLKSLNIPKVKEIKFGAFTCVDNLEIINADNLEKIQDFVFRNITYMKKVSFPSLRSIEGDNFLYRDVNVEEVYMPNIDDESYNMLRKYIKNALIRQRKGAKL